MSSYATPYVFRTGLKVSNRFAVAPLTNTQSNKDGSLSDQELNWLTRRSSSFGLVCSCAAYVSESGKCWEGQLGLSDDKVHGAGLKKLAKEIKARGAAAIVQVQHGGTQATLAPAGTRVGPVEWPGGRQVTKKDMDQIIEDHVAVAKRLHAAGFDGIELHGANGYLLSAFISATNDRSDGYGGDIEGRMKFPIQVARAVRAAVPDSFTVGMRINPVDVFAASRQTLLSDTLVYVKALADAGMDFIHLFAMKLWEAEQDGRHILKEIRAVVPAEVALIVNGGVRSKEHAAKVLEAGGDIVALGTLAIANPDFPVSDEEPVSPPWTKKHLTSVDVGDRFIAYLAGMKHGFVAE